MAAEAAAARGFRALDPCVHCGFCLPACPTYLATGDESDSPRGRIVLMRALERGEIADDDPALLQHLGACLGCRGCEPVCPAGVGYGQGLEAARERLARANGLGAGARLILGVFGRRWLWRAVMAPARWLRDAGLARRLAGSGRLGFAMGMVAATEGRRAGGREGGKENDLPPSRLPATDRESFRAFPPVVALFRGCVMDALFSHVHDATRRTLEANGFRVIEVEGQVCCGALHAHAGDHEGAAGLARANVAAFGGADCIVVNSAGCGALLKDYGHLLDSEASAAFASRVRDVSELLAERGPRPGAPLGREVAYDAPCHLQHAQRVHEAPLAVLEAIPGLQLRLLPGFDRCCGSAGIYSMLEPSMSRAVLEDKIAAIAAANPRPVTIATGNPGCLMQIGAGLLAAGLEIDVRHPVELLDESYEKAGVYKRER
jgi:glycolate oxidase iron-sulfur subunit